MSRRSLTPIALAVLVGFALATLVLRPQGEAAQAQTDLTWRFTSDLNRARGHHTATLLPDGRVLVAGGLGAEGTNTTAELFDPATGRWTLTGHLNQAHGFHTATLLSDGRVLVAGGTGPAGLTNSAELFDPATGSWTLTAPMNQGRTIHTATLLHDGRVLVVGGFGAGGIGPAASTPAEVFDPKTESWTPTDPLPPNEGRAHHTATLLPDGRVLVAGGEVGFAGSGTLRSSAWIFDPSTGSWTATRTRMNAARARHTATLLDDGRVLVAGGSGDPTGAAIASAEIFDPATGRWTLTDFMRADRILHTATLLHDGWVLTVGGLTGIEANAPMLASTELFDPVTETWTPGRELNEARANHTATLLDDGRVLVAGGKAAALSPLPELGSAEIASTAKEQFFAYVTNESSNTVSVIDTLTDAVVNTIPVGETPTGIAASPDGRKVYVANADANTVSVIDTKTNSVVATILEGIGPGPLGMAFTPDSKHVYLTNFGDPAACFAQLPVGRGSTVSVIDTATDTVIDFDPVTDGIQGIQVRFCPTGIATTPDGSRVYVSNEGEPPLPSHVSVIDTATNTVVAEVGVGAIPASIAITPDGTRAYVVNLLGAGPPFFPPGTVSVIDTDPSSPTFNTVVRTIPVGNNPVGSVVAPNGRRVYVMNERGDAASPLGTVSVIETSINAVTRTVAEGIGPGPSGTAITPDGNKVYVANIDPDELVDPDTVSVIDTLTNTVIATITVENQPAGVAITRGVQAHQQGD